MILILENQSDKSFDYNLGAMLLPDSVKRLLLKMMFGRRQTPGLGQLQHLQALLTTLCHLLKPAPGVAEGHRGGEAAGLA